MTLLTLGAGKGVMGISAGTVFGQDSFTDTAGTLLTAHAADLGGPWLANTISNATQVITDANRLRPVENVGTANHYLTVTPPQANYEVEAILRCVTNVGSIYGITGRGSTTVDTSYSLRRAVGTNVWQLVRIATGTPTVLATSGAAALVAGTDYKMTLRMVGDQISGLIDDVLIAAASTDTTLATPGRTGLRSSSSGTTPSNTVGCHFDSFVARTA